MEEEHEMSSLRARCHKKSSSGSGLSCCFQGGGSSHRRRASFDAAASSSSPWSTRTWIKSKTTDHLSSHDQNKPAALKSNNFISRIARRRRHASADFSYDPLSYALNFEESPSDEDEYLHNNFIARLPASPPRRMLPIVPRPGTSVDEVPADGTHDLIRGFDALSTRMIEKRKSFKEELSSPRAAAVADVRRSLEFDEEPSSPVEISSNRENLVNVN